jgi:selenium donor protein
MRPQDLEEVLREIPKPEHGDILVDARDSDDATVWKLDDETAWVQSVDFFTPVVDDPFSFGAIAAANALSDLYAMGATPMFGLNIVAFPVKRLPLSVLHTILEGAQSVAAKAGIHIVGGHTIEDNELKYGMVVNGRIHPDRILRNSGARPGDALVLTKAVGTGILSTALKRGSLNKKWLDQLVESMTELNQAPAELFTGYDIHAVTDVSGFGLLGHLLELARASQVSARVHSGKVPFLAGSENSAKNGMIPGGSLHNLEYVNNHTGWETELPRDKRILLADAQTSGGLLVCLPANEAGSYLDAVRKAGCTRAEIIGEILDRGRDPLIVD